MGTNARARVTNSAKTSGNTLKPTALPVLLNYWDLARCDTALHPRISCSPPSQERVDTDVLDCLSRLSWRHRARPSATLHEIQARS